MNKILLLLFITQISLAQDTNYVRSVIKKLSSKEFEGRGFGNDGHTKASKYLSNEFKKIGLSSFDKNFKQSFPITANVFPDQMEISIDKNILTPGVDYLVHPSCPSIHGKFELVWLNEKIVGNKKKMSKFVQSNLTDKFIIVDKQQIKDKSIREFLDNMIHNPFNAKGIIFIEDEKLTWGTSNEQFYYPVLFLKRSELNSKNKFISLDINAFLEDDLSGENIVGYIRNNKNPNNYIVVSAHYDHIGVMGSNTIFPGANYHSSGIAMLLDMAKYYKEHINELNYSIIFVAFSGEELKFTGSKYFLQSNIVNTNSIKFCLNITAIGNAEQGLSIINSSNQPSSFEFLKNHNIEKRYVMIINKEETISSSEISFNNLSIPSISILSASKKNNPYDLFDIQSNVSLIEYNDCFDLIRDFINQL